MKKLGTFLLAACMFVPFAVIVILAIGGTLSALGAWHFSWRDILEAGAVVGLGLALMAAATGDG
jgi:hypothetical protein